MSCTIASAAKEEILRRRGSLEDRPNILGVDAYKLLKLATEAFLVARCGVCIDPEGLPPLDDDDLLGETRRLPFRTRSVRV